jgi:hypothetical protein
MTAIYPALVLKYPQRFPQGYPADAERGGQFDL